jgi:methionyl-tRNA synthetase
MIEKYRGGITPAVPLGTVSDADAADAADIAAFVAALDGSNGYRPQEALQVVMRMVARANEFVQSSAPWAVAKDAGRSAHLDAILASLSRQIAHQCVLFAPFMPEKAQAAWRQLGGPAEVCDQTIAGLAALDSAGWRVTKGDPLFPKPAIRAA